MIPKLNHFMLTSWPTIHDEEALTALELVGRCAGKINECVTEINTQIEGMNAVLDKLPSDLNDIFNDALGGGAIKEFLQGEVFSELKFSLDQLNARIDSIVASGGNDNTEVVDARNGNTGKTYNTLGAHVRALGNGSGFTDAVRPGTVKAGRLTAGMTAADLRDRVTTREVVALAGMWNENGYYHPDSMEFTSHTGYSMTDFIPCSYGDTFVLESYVFGPSVKPAALFNADKEIISVEGLPGESNWNMIADEIHIGRSDVAYIRFITGAGQVANFRAYRVGMKKAIDAEAYMEGNGYIHMHAKKRTNTVTDRAQIKCWFKLPSNHSPENFYKLNLDLLKHRNVSGWTFRLFASSTAGGYEDQLTYSAHGYTYSPNRSILSYFRVPATTTNGDAVTHVALFIDFLPVNGEDFMDAYIPRLKLGNADGILYGLQGGVDLDTIAEVLPGSLGSPLKGKRILGLGDSLMAGNTLAKALTWFNLMCGGRDMDFYNAAVNGKPIGGPEGMAQALSATLEKFPNPDYIVLNGGANDLRLGVSIEDFTAGLDHIKQYSRVLTKGKKDCKLLVMTNWQRSDYVNLLGLSESDYVVAMIQWCEQNNVPYINNYAGPINLRDGATAAWADEGLVTTGTADLHFSELAHKHIANYARAKLESI